MTRVVKINKTGGPEVLKFETITLDKPGPDEVVIEHKAIGLNFIDTYHRSGLYPLELPSGIGGEAAGVIKEVGSKVKDFSPGDKVVDEAMWDTSTSLEKYAESLSRRNEDMMEQYYNSIREAEPVPDLKSTGIEFQTMDEFESEDAAKKPILCI